MKKSFFKRKGFWIFCLFCLLLAAIGVFVADKKLTPLRELAQAYDLSRVGEKEEMSFINDRSGKEIGTMFVENRFSIPLEEVPPIFVSAVLAQEDQRFYEHSGVDWVGVARAAYLNIKSGSITQGAGTITMQLARKSFDLLGEARRNEWSGYERKIIEAFVALRIEENLHEKLSADFPDKDERMRAVKEQVLETYLNLVPFGSGFYGVRSASLGYFGKEPDKLTTSECASIVACLKNPARISPLNSLSENKADRDHVLRRMAAEKMITEGERDILTSQPVVVNPKPILRGKSFLYEIVAEQARNLVGEEALSQGGYTIETTIDKGVQTAAETELKWHLQEIENMPGYRHPKHADYQRGAGIPTYLQGASLMLDHATGEVIAYVGGRDYSHSQYDFIEDGRRPLGTGFFPFVYAAAFEAGKHPATLLLDEQMDVRKLQVGGDLEGVVGEWGMEIPNPDYEGQISSRRALSASKIGATVQLGQDVGLAKVHKTAGEFGYALPSDPLLNRMLVGFDPVSLPEVVSAYSTFPRGGTRVTQKHFINRILDRDGEVVFLRDRGDDEAGAKRVCSDATAFQVHSILKDVLAKGNLAEESADLEVSLLNGGAKSGTPYGFSDAWMAGYNSRVTCAVWVGFYDGERRAIYPQSFAKKVAFPVWRRAMNAAVPEFAGEAIAMPESIAQVPVCRVSGKRPTRYCNEAVTDPVTGEVVFRSTSKPEFLRRDQDLGICDVHGGAIDIEKLVEDAQPNRVSRVIPIKSQVPLLVGFDPYNSETPVLVPTNDSEQWAHDSNTLIVEDYVRGEREALLTLPKPGRFELPPPNNFFQADN